MGVIVRVTVFAQGRPGFRVAGRFFPVGVTEAVLEDQPGLPVEQQLKQLEHARGGEILPGIARMHPDSHYKEHAFDERGSPVIKSVPLLAFEVVDLAAEAEQARRAAETVTMQTQDNNPTGTPVTSERETP